MQDTGYGESVTEKCEEVSAMEQPTTEVYAKPVVLDAGAVTEVTLGTNNFDTADESQYVKSADD
ncbi:hypothetical protein [Streptomyces sp. NPDC020965]|uniref:hypothetical protein n=1 Tax=Streptomyces sp. NPDC020965 TaxID=3365105 RepID=UPI0037A73ACD